MKVTKNILNHAVYRLNEAMETIDGMNEYSLYGAYGGWQLVRRQNGGIVPVTSGFRSKRELYEFVSAMVYGIRTFQDSRRAEENSNSSVDEPLLF